MLKTGTVDAIHRVCYKNLQQLCRCTLDASKTTKWVEGRKERGERGREEVLRGTEKEREWGGGGGETPRERRRGERE